MSDPKPGWGLADAVDLVQQGYSVAHAAKVTGWAASVIAAQENLRRNAYPGRSRRAGTLMALSSAHPTGRRIGASSGKPRSHRCSLSVWARMLCSPAGQAAVPVR
jgi:hypothetical protein